ncbi:MAG: hypothetical protein RLZZ630_2017 [Bacteroidota bacterium]
MPWRLLIPFLILFLPLVSLAQANLNVQFRGQLTYGSSVDLANVWGYVDSLGNEYALVGTQTGLSIVDVTNPNNPVQRFFIAGTNSYWREVQTWGKYAYVATEGCCLGLQIINLSNLPGSVTSKYWTGTGAVAGQVGRIHTVHVKNGFAYLNGSTLFGGATMIVSLADPWNPVYVSNTQLGFSGNLRYVHDCFLRNDTLWTAHIYGGFFAAINVTNKSNPVLLATQNTPSNFTHNTWLSDQGRRVLFTTDEVSGSYLAAYDVTSVGNITLMDRLQGAPGSGSIIHNTYIQNNFAVNSYYKDGITIVDVARPDNLITVGRYDTYTQGSGNGFNGAWGVYPFLPSGNILVSDIDNGLFVLTPTYVRACYLEGVIRDSCSGLPISGVQVQIVGGTHTVEQSKITGEYKTGTAVSGTFNVVFSKAGYQTVTMNQVVLSNGILTMLDVFMLPVGAVAITSTSVSDVSCNGLNDGAVDLNVTGSSPPFQYQWSGGQVSEDISGLAAGTYLATVVDAIGCSSEVSVFVTEPTPLDVQTALEFSSCSTASDGVISWVMTGGTAPYTLQVFNGASVQSSSMSRAIGHANTSAILTATDTIEVDSLSPGSYSWVVTDANGCDFNGVSVLSHPVNPCQVIVSVRLFVEGFYNGSGSMRSVPGLPASFTDTLLLQVRSSAYPYSLMYEASGLVDTAGWASFTFPSSLWQQSVYLVLRHRNALETWSKDPVFIPSGVKNYIWTENIYPSSPYFRKK